VAAVALMKTPINVSGCSGPHEDISQHSEWLQLLS
jgi:hypothetical protein